MPNPFNPDEYECHRCHDTGTVIGPNLSEIPCTNTAVHGEPLMADLDRVNTYLDMLNDPELQEDS